MSIFQAIRTKYSHSKFLKISTLPVLKSPLVKELANSSWPFGQWCLSMKLPWWYLMISDLWLKLHLSECIIPNCVCELFILNACVHSFGYCELSQIVSSKLFAQIWQNVFMEIKGVLVVCIYVISLGWKLIMHFDFLAGVQN